jgi:hypothetical protein
VASELWISKTCAPLDAADDVTDLVSTMYDPAPFQQFLATGKPGHRVQFVFREYGAYFVVNDGAVLTRYDVWYITQQQATAIMDDFILRLAWPTQAFQDMVNRVLGTSITRIQ